MDLTDLQLNAYIDKVLFFGPEDKARFEDQIVFLKKTLRKVIAENTSLKVTKIKQAGSWRKGTALKPAGGQEIDIDLIVYLDVDEATADHIAQLHQLIIDLLKAAYPNKADEDFTPNPKTVGIEFKGTGLLVDLVPVVPIKTREGYVWQPEQGGGGKFETSPDGQLEFVRKVKETDSRFTQVVRLAKRWRNYAEFDGLSSFAIELIVAHLNRTQKPPDSINLGFMRFLLYVATSQLKEVITFPGAINKLETSTNPVRIYDPTNNHNNALARTTEEQRKEIVSVAERSLQTINHAMSNGRKGETEDLWRSVVGTPFDL